MKCTMKQIFSIVDGRLSTDIDDVYKMLNAATGKNLFTHQLPEAMDYVKLKNPSWYVQAIKDIADVKEQLGDDFETLMHFITDFCEECTYEITEC